MRIADKKSYPLFLIIAIIFTLQNCKSNRAQEIAQWRGVNRDGIYIEKNLLNKWAENGPELLWVYEGIGKGFASPAVLNEMIFVNGEQDSSSFLFAFDLNGQLIWKTGNGKEFMGEGFSSTYPGSRSTPTVFEDLVYTTSGKGRIACIETKSGKERWAVDIIKDLGGLESEFGYSESVVVDHEKVYCFPGGDKINMAALDRFTGKTVWTSELLKDTFSYCSPVLTKAADKQVLISHSRHNLYTVDCNNGKLLASYPLVDFEYDGEHCNSPLYSNGFIYFIGNDEKGEGALKLEMSQNGGNLNKIWHNKKMRNNFNGYVLVDNKLFTTVKGNWLKTLSANSGTVTDSIRIATGSLIYADNKFICYGMNGEISLIDYNQNNLEVQSSFRIEHGDGHHFSHPVIANGIMYIRHGNALIAYKIK